MSLNSGYEINAFGGVAQLGERLLCTQEVRGSNPLISTAKVFAFARAFFLVIGLLIT